MAKIGILCPFKEIEEISRKLIEKNQIDIAYLKTTNVAEVVSEARKAIDEGIDIIISRGYQARILKDYTNIPVIEMKIQTQEIALLIKKAKKMLPHKELKIAIVCFQNMLGKVNVLGDILDVDFRTVYIDKLDESMEEIRKLKEEGFDLIIGGKTICNDANTLGLPALQYVGTEDSVVEAVEEAKRLQYALEIEKRSDAQLESILDTTFNGVIKINAEGNIIVINHLVENLIGMMPEEVVGKNIIDIFPEFDGNIINSILSGEKDHYIISVNIRRHAWILNMAPIQYNSTITGAILSLQKISEKVYGYSETRKKLMRTGYTVSTMFDDIKTFDPQMKKQLELAKKYTLSDSPILIYAEGGTEYFRVAEAIHNGSSHKNSPFVSVNLETMSDEEQLRCFFKKNSDGSEYPEETIFAKAQQGTIFINSIERMSRHTQENLLNILLDYSMRKTDVIMSDLCMARIIASTKMNLMQLVEENMFSEELFYVLQGLTLFLPPIRERKEDLCDYFEKCFKESCKKYNKYLILTDGAMKKITEYQWRGNQFQIKTFCESLVVHMDRRKVDEVIIQDLYEQLYPTIKEIEGTKRVVVYKTQEADEISRLMDKYYGNRNAVAQELGISKTTLWRKMKKYGITGNR